MSSPPALSVTGLYARYGKVDVLHDISLHVAQSEFVVIVGANGAGKSTTLRALTGLLRPSAGEIHVNGVRISGWSPSRIGRGYVSLVPEGRRLFSDQTVEANLLLGAFHLRRDRTRVRHLLDSVYSLFPKLLEYRQRTANSLSGGEQQMVAIGRALMADPQVLLLDEPSLGLAPKIFAQVFEALTQLRERGRSILLVEQRVEEALAAADRAYVMERGSIILEGTGAQLASSTDLVNAYLGEAKSLEALGRREGRYGAQ